MSKEMRQSSRSSRDFTLKKYEELLKSFIENRYRCITPSEYVREGSALGKNRVLLLRHDVDKNCLATVKFAEMEYKYDLRAVYYFRRIDGRFDTEAIKKIVKLNHEIGYHYEVLARAKGDYIKAIELFSMELEELRRIAPVQTICMHGSPLNKWDNRKLWERYDYRDFGIQFEPYFDLDFNQFLYLTDTGRKWNGDDVNLRDKVMTQFTFKYKSTSDILEALRDDVLSDRLLINCHPHRWNDELLPWIREFLWQNTKNLGKWMLIKLSLQKLQERGSQRETER